MQGELAVKNISNGARFTITLMNRRSDAENP